MTDEQLHEYTTAFFDDLGARLVVVAILTHDDRLRVSVLGTGRSPDVAELEEAFDNLIENMRDDLNFVQPAGNA